jgi:hypothetical protein
MPSGRLEEAFDRIGRERHIVVHQQEVVGGPGGRELGRGRQRAGDASVVPQRHHPRLAERLSQELERAVGGAVVHRDDAHARMGLRGEGLEAPPQPGDGVARDEHDEHAGRADVVGRGRSIDGCRGHEGALRRRAA